MKFNKKNNILVIDEAIFEVDSYSSFEGIKLDIDLKEIHSVKINPSHFLDNLYIIINSSDGFGTFLFYELHIFKSHNGNVFCNFYCNQPNKYWNGKYGLNTLLVELHEQINLTNELSSDPESLEIEDDWKTLEAIVEIENEFIVSDIVDKYSTILKDTLKRTELTLSGAIWRKEFETNEKLFCTELLYPLLRKMDFIDVRFTHGTREYGKDFTFSDYTKFGNLRNYAMQVKAGNMRGNVNADIDEIIGQLDDAFAMPYFEVSANEERRINTFIIAISGNFTGNAKEKIANKIPPNLKGSVYMLDREKIMELVERFWK